MCVPISKLIYKKINFEYKTTIQVHLSENNSFEDSFFAIHNSNAFGLFSNKQAIDNPSKSIHVLQ
jgi:hypothetical protein